MAAQRESAGRPGTGDTGPPPAREVEAARVLARLARVVEQACQETGVSLPQYRLLAFVSRQSQRASELAGRAAVSRPTLTALVGGLERQGLLRRAPVPGDRRGIRLVLTAAGRSALARTDRRLGSALVELTDESDARGLIDALCRIGTTLDRRFSEAIRKRLDAT